MQQEKLPEVQDEKSEKELQSSEIELALDALKDAFSSQSMSRIRQIFEESGRDVEITAARLQQCIVPLEQSNSQRSVITPMATDQEIPMGGEGEQPSEESKQQQTEEKQITTPKPKKRVKIKRPQERRSPGSDARNEVRVPNESITTKKPQQSPPQKKSRNCRVIETVFAKYQSLDEESDRVDRKKLMESIQADELEANYLFDDELPKIIEAILTENEKNGGATEMNGEKYGGR